ncbi:hypothetical protein ACV3JQ_16255, partial [Klebsiella pneumoniae]
RMAEYLVLYNSKRPHKSLELMTPVDYILRESKNCNMWWTHTGALQAIVHSVSVGYTVVIADRL